MGCARPCSSWRPASASAPWSCSGGSPSPSSPSDREAEPMLNTRERLEGQQTDLIPVIRALKDIRDDIRTAAPDPHDMDSSGMRLHVLIETLEAEAYAVEALLDGVAET